jgi:hypothetical protein
MRDLQRFLPFLSLSLGSLGCHKGIEEGNWPHTPLFHYIDHFGTAYLCPVRCHITPGVASTPCAQNTQLIMLAVCALPVVPFKNVFCMGYFLNMILSLPSYKLTCIQACTKAHCVKLGLLSQQIILEALALVKDATATHACHLVMHGESVHCDLTAWNPLCWRY